MSIYDMASSRKRARSSSNGALPELLKASREAYSKGEYEEALGPLASAWSAAHKHSNKELFEVLDLKCAILVKIGQLDRALEAAKSMIRSDKQNARGYCRAASIERSRNNLEAAWKYLDHGRSRVSPSDGLFSHLLEQLDKIQGARDEAMTTMKPVDPATVFPLEVFEMVLLHVPYKQVVISTRVSRSWRNVLLRVEPLLTTLDMRVSTKQISGTMLKAALDRLVIPRVIAVHNLAPKIGFLLVKALKHSRKFASLETLTLNKTDIQVDAIPFDKFNLKVLRLGIECRVSTSQIFHTLQMCPGLIEARFRRVYSVQRDESPSEHSTLQVLHLGNPFEISSFSIPPVCFAAYPKLRSLVVSGAAVSSKASWDLSANHQLEYLNTFASVIRSIRLPPSLREWLWDGTQISQFVTTRESLESLGSLPYLESICLSGGNTAAALKHLLASNIRHDQLLRVELKYRQDVMLVRGLRPENNMIGSARTLTFECDTLQDTDLPAFVLRFPNLQELCLVAPQISGVFIKDLLGRPENQIGKIVLKHCVKISQDTIGWVSSRNIEIHAEECMMPQEEARLKRSQYARFVEQHRD